MERGPDAHLPKNLEDLWVDLPVRHLQTYVKNKSCAGPLEMTRKTLS
jgi:hypothetical protein